MGGVEATAKDMPSPTRAVDAARRADGAAADASFTSHDASLSSPLSVGGAVFHAPMEHAGLSFSPSPTRVNAAADGTPADDTPARERHHREDAGAGFADEALRLLTVLRLDVEGDVLANAHVGQLSEADVRQIVGDGLALRIEEGGQRENVDGGVKNHGLCRGTEADEQGRRQRIRN